MVSLLKIRSGSASRPTRISELEIEDILFRSPGRPSRKPFIRYKSFRYRADGWTTPRRVVAKVEHHAGELFRASASS
jgi:hypothetical protein